MPRFTPDFFDSVYRETPPWDIGAAQPAMMALLDEYPPAGPVLDVGCGSGDLVIELGRRGVQATGIDVVEAAIEQARVSAQAQPPDVAARIDFQVADALRPTLLQRRFGAVVDSGFYHVFEQDNRDLLARELADMLLPGCRYYLLGFATEFDMPNTPLKVTEDELRARFTPADGWRILALRPAQFESRYAPVPALAACIERSAEGGG